MGEMSNWYKRTIAMRGYEKILSNWCIHKNTFLRRLLTCQRVLKFSE